MTIPRKTAAKKSTAKKTTAKKTTAPKTTAAAPTVDPETPEQQHEHAFADKIDQYPEDFLACRDMGHAWKPVTAQRRPNGTISRILACVRCDTTRHQNLDQRGYILDSTYTYKTGYSLPGTGRLTSAHRAALRIKNILGD